MGVILSSVWHTIVVCSSWFSWRQKLIQEPYQTSLWTADKCLSSRHWVSKSKPDL